MNIFLKKWTPYILLPLGALLATHAAATCEKAEFIALMCDNNCEEESNECESVNYLRNDEYWALAVQGAKNKNVSSTPRMCSVLWNKLDAEGNCITSYYSCTEDALGYKYFGLCPTGIE